MQSAPRSFHRQNRTSLAFMIPVLAFWATVILHPIEAFSQEVEEPEATASDVDLWASAEIDKPESEKFEDLKLQGKILMTSGIVLTIGASIWNSLFIFTGSEHRFGSALVPGVLGVLCGVGMIVTGSLNIRDSNVGIKELGDRRYEVDHRTSTAEWQPLRTSRPIMFSITHNF